MIASASSTSLDVIEKWPPEKTAAYFDTAMKARNMLNPGPA